MSNNNIKDVILLSFTGKSDVAKTTAPDSSRYGQWGPSLLNAVQSSPLIQTQEVPLLEVH